jgi:hypothetical protein
VIAVSQESEHFGTVHSFQGPPRRPQATPVLAPTYRALALQPYDKDKKHL